MKSILIGLVLGLTFSSTLFANESEKLPPKKESKQAPDAPTPAPAATAAATPAAPTKGKKVTLSKSKTLKFMYASSPWNKKSSKIDTAFLFLRDKSTGKIAKIVLSESEPDSSQFSGMFSIGWNTQQIEPEIYIPPKGMRNDVKSLIAFSSQLKNKKIKRKPYVFKMGLDGVQTLDVYDTKEQAEQAIQAHLNQARAEKEKKNLTLPVPNKQSLEVAKMLEHKAKLATLAAQAASREADRVRLEQLARQQALEKKRQQQALNAAERDRRKKQAANLAAQALAKYNSQEYPQAVDLFAKGVELDPSNMTYYFQYGVSLYRIEKFNDALINLSLSEDNLKTALEKKFFIGLCHYRLKELTQATTQFQKVKEANDPALSPSAAFYQGIILFTLEKYQEAKSPFEYVLDNSKDPRLDEKAEQYLEKIASLIIFKRKQTKKNVFTATLGLMHDSNVLLSPDGVETQGQATNQKDLRYPLGLGYERRLFYKRKKDMSVKFDTSAIISSQDASTPADPYMWKVSTPYTWKGTTNDKGYKLTVAPSYEYLFMDADGENSSTGIGSAEGILSSPMLTTSLILVNDQFWFSNYSIDIRMDDSKTTITDDADDADSMKYSLLTTQTFLDASKKEAVIVSGGVVYNAATGDNKTYQRLQLGVLYSRPFRGWDASWNGALDFYYISYPDETDSRADQNMRLSYGVNRPINKQLSWGVNLDYTNNGSSVDSNSYSRYSAIGSLSYNLDY